MQGNGTTLGVVHLFLDLAGLVVSHAGTGRDQTTDDDVLLQATELIALAHDRRFGQHPGGFLEGRRRDERVGRQRGLGDAQQHVDIGCRQLAFATQPVVGVEKFRAFDLLAQDVAAVARVGDLHAAQHLANDHLDVLVVDLHTLQTVDVLNLIDDVARKFLDAEQAQDVLRIGRTVDD